MHPLIVKAAIVAVTALTLSGVRDAGQSTGGAGAATDSVEVVTVIPVYIVRSGDTLSEIAARYCGGNTQDYWALARASGISNPNLIYPGERILIKCATSSPEVIRRQVNTSSDGDGSTSNGNTSANGQAAVPGTTIEVYSYFGLEELWEANGGSQSTAGDAACIAEHESGGRIWVVSPTNDWGLWQIHDGGPAMLDANANARRAIAMSDDGRNWAPWTTAPDCGL